jgi:hypothetical protein
MPGKGFTPRDIILKNTRQSQAPPTAEPSSGRDAGHPAPGAPDPYTWHYRIQLLPWMHGVEGHAGLPSSLAHASRALGHAYPALCRVRVEWRRVLLGPRGSLPPLHATVVTSRHSPQDQGSGWLATPFLQDARIPGFLPVYPGYPLWPFPAGRRVGCSVCEMISAKVHAITGGYPMGEPHPYDGNVTEADKAQYNAL